MPDVKPAIDRSNPAHATPEAANRQRWDGQRRGHYEVWYLTCTHRPSGVGFWIRYTLEAPEPAVGEPYAQLWFAAFDRAEPGRNVALHRSFPIAAMTAAADPFAVAIAGSTLTHRSAIGELVGDGHRIRWSLTWAPSPTLHLHLPPVMYRRGGLGETTVLSPNLRVPLHGWIEVDGRRFVFTGEPAGQTHLWGRKHAHAWAWGHCVDFVGAKEAALEILTVRLRRGGVTLPPLTLLTLEVDGERYAFTRFRQLLRRQTSATITTASYAFTARSRGLRLRGAFRCRPEDMVVAPYVDPDGAPSFCANTEVGDLEVIVEARRGGGWREVHRLVAEGTAHFEIGGRERDPAIVRDHRALGIEHATDEPPA